MSAEIRHGGGNTKKGVKKGSAQAREYAHRKQDEHTFWTVKVIAYTQQEILDAVSLTLNEEFGLGAERLMRFRNAWDKKYAEIHELQQKNDDDYSVTVIEKALQNAWGKYYTPREERYSFKIRVGNKEVDL